MPDGAATAGDATASSLTIDYNDTLYYTTGSGIVWSASLDSGYTGGLAFCTYEDCGAPTPGAWSDPASGANSTIYVLGGPFGQYVPGYGASNSMRHAGELFSGAATVACGADGTVFVGSAGTGAAVWGLRGDTLATRWSAPIGGALGAPIVGRDGTVFVTATEGVVYAINGATGWGRWAAHTNTSLTTTPAEDAVSGTIFVTGDVLYAFNGETGLLLWTFSTSLGQGAHVVPMTSSPAVNDGVVAFGGADSLLYGIDAATGALRWSYAGNRAGGTNWSAPVSANNGW